MTGLFPKTNPEVVKQMKREEEFRAFEGGRGPAHAKPVGEIDGVHEQNLPPHADDFPCTD